MADADQTFVVGQGDVDPRPLAVELYDAADEPIILEDVDRVRFTLCPVESDEPILSGRGSVGEEVNVVEYEWGRGDLDIEPRVYQASFEIRFGDRSTLTAPTIGRLFVKVTEVN